MTRFRRNLLLAGLSGLLVCGVAALLSAWLVTTEIIKPPLSHPVVTLLLAFIFGSFSLAEIPMMVFSMRRLSVERSSNHVLVWGLNGFYVFFAAVYGVPVLLLSGSVGWGLILCGFGILRFVASMFYVHECPS